MIVLSALHDFVWGTRASGKGADAERARRRAAVAARPNGAAGILAVVAAALLVRAR